MVPAVAGVAFSPPPATPPNLDRAGSDDVFGDSGGSKIAELVTSVFSIGAKSFL